MEATINIFFIDEDPYEAARWAVDKHVVKMIVETAQMLSTAHRLLDGTETVKMVLDKNGRPRKKKVWVLPDHREDKFYNVTHANHPSTVWTRTSVENYNWLVDHLHGLLQEYTYRYDKIHATDRIFFDLQSPPLNLKDYDWTTPPLCMDDYCKVGNYVDSYREFYRKGKAHLHSWKRRGPPAWL
jgi:hypothetical protein